MLISVYENKANPVKFSSKLDTTVTLPKNATIKLNKAFIPRNHIVSITDANNSISVNFHNERQSDATLSIPVANGNYGVEEFITLLNASAAARIGGQGEGQNSDFSLVFEYDRTLGVGAGCIVCELRGNKPYANFWARMNWSRTSVGAEQTWNDAFDEFAAATDTMTIIKSDDDMRCSLLETTIGNVNKKTWTNHWGLKKIITNNWWEKVNVYEPALTLIRPQLGHNWGGVSFNIGSALNEVGKDNSFWVGITKSIDAIDTSLCTDSDISTLDQMNGVLACIAFYGETANGKNKGDVEIFENLNGTFTSLGVILASTGDVPIKDDTICICVPQNSATEIQKTFEYHVRHNADGADWTEINAGSLSSRPKPAGTDNLFMVGGFYNSSGGDLTIKDMKFGGNSEMPYDDAGLNAGSGFFSHYGRAGQVHLSGASNNNKDMSTVLGFSEAKLEGVESNPFNILSKDFISELDLVHFDNSANQPFINLKITNLPIDSIACDSVDSATRVAGEVHHSSSKTIACLSRYDADGSGKYTDVTIMTDAQNESTIHLKNASEITLNSLDFELRNGDGSIPTDLASPLGLILEIN